MIETYLQLESKSYRQQSQSVKRGFTIREIEKYLDGCLMLQFVEGKYTARIERNQSLREAIANLNDKEDGIAVVTKRNNHKNI